MVLLSYLGLITNFIPAILGLIFWQGIQQAARWFTMMMLIIAVNGLGGYFGEYYFENNLPFFHFYILVEGSFLIFIFSRLLESFIHRLIPKIMFGLYVSCWLVNVAFFDGPLGYPTSILAIEAVTLIAFASAWFFMVLKESKIVMPARTFGFWLSTGVLIFFSGNLLLFIFSNYTFSMENHVFRAIWDIHAILVLVIHAHFILAIIWAKKNPILS